MQVLVIGIVLLLAAPALAADPVAKKPGGILDQDARNTATVHRLYERFMAAWNRHDAEGMAAMWAIDGDHVEPDGRMAKGRDEVEELFRQEHATVFRDSELQLRIDSVWFITEDVALVDGFYDLAGVHDPEGKELPLRNGRITSVLLRDDETWKVAASRTMLPVKLEWRER